MNIRWIGAISLAVALLVTSAGTGHAWRGGRFHVGFHHGFRHAPARFFFGVGIGPFWPYAYAYPYAYPPAVVVPPAYIPPATQGQYWWYCDNPPGYDPYVPSCLGGWRPVAPTPQS
jgi:hypothetical protein